MGDWNEVKPRPWNPCDGCVAGYCSISQKVVNGKLYSKTDDCHEACERFNNYHYPEKNDAVFGTHIKEAIRIIRGKSHKELGGAWQGLADEG